MNDSFRQQMAVMKHVMKDVAEAEYERRKKEKLIEDAVSEYFYTTHAEFHACEDCIKKCVVVKQLERIGASGCMHLAVQL
jgi:hypothetical protein